jgi:hypothetical protein
MKLCVVLLTQMCWERKWRAEYLNTCTCWVLPMYVFSLQMALVSLLPSLLITTALSTWNRSRTPTETEFWMIDKTQILWLFILHLGSMSMKGTKNERQGRKEKNKREGKRDARAIWWEGRYIRHMWKVPAVNSQTFVTVNDTVSE